MMNIPFNFCFIKSYAISKGAKFLPRKAIRQSHPYTDLGRPLDFEGFGLPTISREPLHEGGKVVIPAQRLPFPPPPKRYFCYSFN